jgi:hypothetical protein
MIAALRLGGSLWEFLPIMNMESDVGEAILSLPLSNGRELTFQEQPELTDAVRNAVENHRVRRISSWMLAALLGSVLGGAIIYFLAVSPYVVSVLAPLFQAQ